MRTKNSSDFKYHSWHPADWLRLAFLLLQERFSGDTDACKNLHNRKPHQDTCGEVLYIRSAGGFGQGAAGDVEEQIIPDALDLHILAGDDAEVQQHIAAHRQLHEMPVLFSYSTGYPIFKVAYPCKSIDRVSVK